MAEHRLTPLQIHAFARHLLLEEKSAATIEKYLRDVRAFAGWLDGQEITKERNAAWKAHLAERGYAPAGINAKLSALNSLLEFLGLRDCRVKFLKVQRRLFRDAGRELTKAEYQSLLDAAHRLGRDRLGLLVEAIGATGIRVSEVRYLTVEAARQGPRDPAAGQTLPEAAPIRRKTKDRLRRDLSHQKRKRDEPPADLGGDEAAVQIRRGGAREGVPPQSAASVRHGVLPGLPGHRQTV